ncbi:double-stranded DNA 3'-5' exodeoxyribonuclease [Aureococcus anophagefferens]|nr:double-stranded DNA 3'-5' exodeoxyribonuclease [Aureococcus anophagefferens]
MEGADDERSAVSSDLGDASEDEELGALGDFRPSALGLSPPPGRLFKSASSAASSSPTLSLPESFDNLGSVASGPGGAPRAPGNYLEYGLRQQLEAELQSATEKRHAEREAYGERLEALGRDNGQLRSRVESLGGELARVKRTLRDRRDAIDAGSATAGLRTAAKLADCEIAKKRLEARLSFLEEQHGKSLDAAEAAHQRAVAAAEAKRADGADYRAALSDEAVREKRVALADAQKALAANADDFRARLEDRSAELAAATEKQITIIRSERETFEGRELAALRDARDAVEDARASASAPRQRARRRPAPTPPRPSRRVADMAEAAAGGACSPTSSRRRRRGSRARSATPRRSRSRTALKEQVDVASREVAALEERLASSRRERDATVDGLEHKVRAYETLELELDSAVLRCADGTRASTRTGTCSRRRSSATPRSPRA